MWRKIEIKIRIENRLSFLCLVILIIDHIRWHAFIIKTLICCCLCLESDSQEKFLKRKRKIRWFYHFATTRAHAYRSLKRKSQCQLWSLQWSIQSFLNVIFEQPSSFLQVQSTNNCLWVSQSYPKYGKYVFYPKIREPTSSCIWQIMPAAERIYHIYMLRYLCEPNWWS